MQSNVEAMYRHTLNITKLATALVPMKLPVRSPQRPGVDSHKGGCPYPDIYKACIVQAMVFIGRVSLNKI